MQDFLICLVYDLWKILGIFPKSYLESSCQVWTLRPFSFFTFLVDDQMSDQEDTETSASTLPRPKSVTEGSAFDENSLNQAQFINLLDKFIGHMPIK